MDDYIFLLAEKRTEQNEQGDWEATEPERRRVFAVAKSPTRAEFFGSLQAGYTTAMVFEISAWDYADEPKLEYQGFRYSVKKVYRKNTDTVELSCERSGA